MFNQKVNGYTAENPDYLSFSYGAPRVKPVDIHNCGKTILTYSKPDKNIPIETWLSKNTAVESFAMRPIVNSKEYFESINKYLSDIIYKDSVELKKKDFLMKTIPSLTITVSNQIVLFYKQLI